LSLPTSWSHGHDDLTAEQTKALDAMARRREAGEPLARILGRAAFWDFEVGLNAATLVPRDDTGALVEAALALLPLDSTAHVVDLGTGSGIVLLALARERPHISGIGIDLDPSAVEQAERNAAALGLGERLAFQQSAGLRCFDRAARHDRSNPPYIRSGDMAGLAREVREHDPELALVAGPKMALMPIGRSCRRPPPFCLHAAMCWLRSAMIRPRRFASSAQPPGLFILPPGRTFRAMTGRSPLCAPEAKRRVVLPRSGKKGLEKGGEAARDSAAVGHLDNTLRCHRKNDGWAR
jgi:SAM-dependent methyltransferase